MPTENPMETDGLEFVEYTALDNAALRQIMERMGFAASRATAPRT